MSIHSQRLSDLRSLMTKHNIDAVILPSADAHQSEYVAPYWKSRNWLSGFSGSMGTAVVTSNKAGVCTDGRYFIQAENELKDTGFELFKMTASGFVNDLKWIADFLVENLPSQAKVAFDARSISSSSVNYLKKKFKNKKIELVIDLDLINQIWTDRPEIGKDPIFDHDVVYAGKSRLEKLSIIRQEMAARGATHHLLSTLDDIAWLYNFRGHDVKNTPVAYAYTLIGQNEAWLFIDLDKVSEALKAQFKADKIEVLSYSEVRPKIQELKSSDIIWFDGDNTNYWLSSAISEEVEIVEEASSVTSIKAIKNDVEIKNLKNCHIKDGVAMEKFFYWLEKSLPNTTITEISAAEKLENFRKEQPLFIEPSFGTIAAYKEHAAMMHYSATPENQHQLKQAHFFLLDSGGQYLDGTTDMTRTVALGELTEEEKIDYTLVLKAHLGLAMVKFVKGTTGTHLDVIARMPLWKHGLDYKCGTGHGVGMLLSVHEAGPRFANQAINTIKFEIGHIITNEPGVYKQDKHGIRLENTHLVQKDQTTPYGGEFLSFDTISYCHIDLKPVVVSMLTSEEKDFLNDYHSKVYQKLSPFLTPEEQSWLKTKTADV